MKKIPLFLFITYLAIISQSVFAQWTIQGFVAGLGGNPCISVYAPGELIVAGGTLGLPRVFKSTNSGVNWINITGNVTGPELFSIWAVNENLIFAGDGGSNGGAGGNAKVWKTTNGGLNWSIILTTGGTAGFFNGIVFSRTNPLIGIAQSDPPVPNGPHYLAKTTDGGITWNTQTTISTNGPAIQGTVICIDNLFYGWGIYPPARVILTGDGGVTWNQSNISGGNSTQGFAFSSDKLTGVAVSNNTLPFVSRTSDGGVTWISINSGLPVAGGFPKVKWVYGTNTCYLISETGTNGCAGKSTDGGLSWSIMTTDGITGLLDIDLVNINGTISAYSVTNTGSIMKLSDVIGMVPIGSTIPSEYMLYQNYPNPFNPETKIRFAIPQGSSKSETFLSVYDVIGKEVAALIQEQLNPGTYEVDFNASNFPSGVYFYKLSSGSYTETKKMILVK